MQLVLVTPLVLVVALGRYFCYRCAKFVFEEKKKNTEIFSYKLGYSKVFFFKIHSSKLFELNFSSFILQVLSVVDL